MYSISYRPEAVAELDRINAYVRVRLLTAIGEHLAQPLAMGGGKKKLDLGNAGFIYQLRVGDYRVFYDVDEEERMVIVRHVRRKGRKTTGEIL